MALSLRWGENVCQDSGGLGADLPPLCGSIIGSLESTLLEGLTQGTPSWVALSLHFFELLWNPFEDPSLASPITVPFGPLSSGGLFGTLRWSHQPLTCRTKAWWQWSIGVLASLESPSYKSVPSGLCIQPL